ncbi:MAG TPA: serine hydrolase domain-containing protein [Chloroflexota bacterium]|jgi:CubicO group peptidase (beta-lactamase class C family)
MAAEDAVRGIQVEGAWEAGCDPDALRRALALAAGWVDEGVVPAVGALVARGGRVAGEAYLGRRRAGREGPVDAATLWSLASISKPFTAAAAMLLVDQGRLSLDEPVCGLVPEFLDAPATAFDRRAVTPRQLLGHCSGLPGFSEDNLALRRAHRPIEEFVRSHLRQPLLFEPGTAHVYSNVAIMTAAEMVGRAAAGSLGRRVEAPAIEHFYSFARERLFGALGMTSTGFRPPAAWHDRIAWVEETGQEGEDWETDNSAYYRGLGFPWGAVYGTVREVARFADLFVPGANGAWRLGAPAGAPRRVLSPAAARAMRSVQWRPPDAPPDLAPELREGVPSPPRPEVVWGIGWGVQGAGRGADFTSPATFFHGGSSGTLIWADPETDLVCALFTNRAFASGWAADRPRPTLFANAVVASLR